MECDVCSRDFNDRRTPLCASCAQVTLYAPRIQQVSVLLDREKHHTYAEAVVRPGNDGVLAALPQDADWDAITTGVKGYGLERLKAEQEAVESRINDITTKAEELRRQIDEYKQYAAKQKELHAGKREELAIQKKQLDKHKPRVTDAVQSATKKAHQRLEKVHNRAADARRLLCWESAALGGLSRRSSKDNTREYWLGGLPVPDIRELNVKVNSMSMDLGSSESDALQPHEVVSASLDNICRLVGNCCHYLAIRLPAEIILPHNDFPHAAILPEKASYKYTNLPYPVTALSHSSLAASRLVDRKDSSTPRSRLLHLDRPLPQLLKEDFKAFHLFVEGVMLLAWDIAWLCRTQGLDNMNTFDDICAIGKNIHQLLFNESQVRPSLDRKASTASSTKRGHAQSAPPSNNVHFGSYSHSSAQHSLSGHQGTELLRGWRLASPARLIDKLKSYLLNEISGAEWDFLSGEEWDEEREDEVAVLVGGQRRSLDRYGPAMSVMSVKPSDGPPEASMDDAQKRKGSSGWTKVRGRGTDG